MSQLARHGGLPMRTPSERDVEPCPSAKAAIANEVRPIVAMLKDVQERQVRLETVLAEVREHLLSRAPVKEWYSPAEAAADLGRQPYTVREWCRLGRISARKRRTGRGDAVEWEVSHEELTRIRNHGLLPIPSRY